MAAQIAKAKAPRLSQQLAAVAGIPGTAALGASDAALKAADGRVRVTVTGSNAAAAVKAGGGKVLAQAHGSVSSLVPASALQGLAATAGVSGVSPSRPAYVQGTTSEGVHASNADSWITAGKRGAGVKVGIVDMGFSRLDQQVLAGNLPAGTTVVGNHCGANVNQTDHGTAVAEIVHQMAPDAQLFLYCIVDNIG
ncbi:MAG: hypothetical protein QOD87_1521, partial [Pseudonocardiales bacterium]|nr:hypothetical protein [Pseudonocardiales bacterium]